jgi:predicted ATPase/DNA-binding CsgD family transcriptional regulator
MVVTYSSDRSSLAARNEPLLPVYLTPLIGRTRELSDLTDLVQQPDARLITLTGAGGVGKTRLAVGLAETVAAKFPGGIWFVSLASLKQSESVLPTIAHAFGLPDTGDRLLSDLMRRAWTGDRALLILDNFDAVVDAAPLIVDLLRTNPHMTVIVTTRVSLRLRGEHEFLVAPFQVPEGTRLTADAAAKLDAVALYVRRSQAVKPDFELADDNAPTIAEICRRLDGLPLAIELAAARSKVLPPAAMLGRLESRLPLLTGGSSDLPDRQRTMRDAIAWSYDLLTPAEQTLFRRLSYFSGGFSLEAAEAVAGDHGEGEVLDRLASLLDKNLIYQVVAEFEATRCAMLETIREFGLVQLVESGEADAVARRHAEWFQTYGEWAELVMNRSPLTMENLELVDADHNNFRSALQWLEQHQETEAWVRLATNLGGYWFFRSWREEGREWFRKCLLVADNPEFDQLLRGWALGYAGFLNGGRPEAIDHFKAAAEIFEKYGETFGHAGTLIMLAEELTERGDHHQAAELCERALPVMRELGQQEWVAYGLFELACSNAAVGDFQLALLHADDALRVAHESGDLYAVGHVMALKSLIHSELRTFDEAAECMRASLDSWRQIGMKEGIASGLAAAVVLAVSTSQLEEAARIHGGHRALAESIGFVSSLPERLWFDRACRELKDRLAAKRFHAADAEGQTQSLEQIIEMACQLRVKPEALGSPEDKINLTSRELEVLRLIADGRTDREIATALEISPNTATRHVANIFVKLDVTSRTAAATYAIRHGLG